MKKVCAYKQTVTAIKNENLKIKIKAIQTKAKIFYLSGLSGFVLHFLSACQQRVKPE